EMRGGRPQQIPGIRHMILKTLIGNKIGILTVRKDLRRAISDDEGFSLNVTINLFEWQRNGLFQRAVISIKQLAKNILAPGIQRDQNRRIGPKGRRQTVDNPEK